MSIRRKLKRQDYEAKPFLAWNAYVHLLAVEKYEDLTPVQADASLIFWYDSEVQNGGHFQYFVNKGVVKAELAVTALGRLDATNHQRILSDAIDLWNSRERHQIQSVQEFCDEARARNFKSLDHAYYLCKPAIKSFLEDFLRNHFEEFIELG